MFNVEVDLGGNLGTLCGFYSLDGGQSGERHEEEGISKATEHAFCRSKLQEEASARDLGRSKLCRGCFRDFFGDNVESSHGRSSSQCPANASQDWPSTVYSYINPTNGALRPNNA